MKFLRTLFEKKPPIDAPARVKSRRPGPASSDTFSWEETAAGQAEAKASGRPSASSSVGPLTASRDNKKATSAVLKEVAAKLKEGEAPASAAQPASGKPGIWDMGGDSGPSTSELLARSKAAEAAAASEKASPSRPSRPRRTKTRLIGFDTSEGAVVDLFDDETPVAKPVRSTKFPVGWILVVDGPGRGESFPLSTGMSPIGRGDDQIVQLDFGDSAISRSNHAAVVYDPDERSFLLGHGGKSNIVRLNGKPVISNEALKSGDEIKIGETTLRFVALCGPDFDWAEKEEGGDGDDMAIA
ncbi:MAG: FHA domain-containing protein [Pseudomonadota bacterium]